ncbi:MAG TPA: hypothetical protein VFK50_11365 [Sphingomicrobium sp.]|nr:hypothetical protein [Sphingomicrobium sp.]
MPGPRQATEAKARQVNAMRRSPEKKRTAAAHAGDRPRLPDPGRSLGKRLKLCRLRSISPVVRITKLFAILIAAAMLFAPFAMQSGAAMAAMPSDQHAQTMDKGHCEGQPAGDKGSKSADTPCCAAMCAAVAVAAGSPAEPPAFSPAVERPPLNHSLHGFLARLPTPPPRLA